MTARDEWIAFYLDRRGFELLHLASSNGYETRGLTYRQIAELLADETIRLTIEANAES